MKTETGTSQTAPSSTEKIKEIMDMQNSIDSISRLVINVDEVNNSINQTLFIKDNFLVDLQNFSVMTLPTAW